MKGCWHRVDSAAGNGLYLSPHPHLHGVYENSGYKKNFIDLFVLSFPNYCIGTILAQADLGV